MPEHKCKIQRDGWYLKQVNLVEDKTHFDTDFDSKE
jgi:hypothetical protein